VKIDGITLARGSWHGQLAPGRHRFEADAPGWIGVIQDVDVDEAANDEVTLELKPEPRPPGRPSLGIDVDRRWYLAASLGVFGGELPIKATQGGPQGLVAAMFVARLGRRFGKYLGVELDGELMAGGTREYPPTPGMTLLRSYQVSHIALGAGLRFVTSTNSPRLTLAGIGGVLNQKIAYTDHPSGGGPVGGAPSGFLQIEGGGQIDLSHTISLEGVVMIGMMGLNSDDPTTKLELAATHTVMTRYGAKITLQFSF
jgi:hypothetical protein